MYDYMRALENRFNSKPNYEQRQQLEAKRQEIFALLDKQGKKKLLRLVDTHIGAGGSGTNQFHRWLLSGLGNRSGTQYRQQLFLRSGAGHPFPGRG